MKKIIALMLFVCLMLVACGQNDGDDVESSKIESSEVESSNESSETSNESSEAESSESENESSEAESSEVSTESSEESSEVESSEPVIESSEPVETSKPEVPSQPEVPEVPEVSEKPTEPTLAAWKQAYLDYIEDYNAREYGFGGYALVYVDGDDIPELYILGGYAAAGDYVVSYKNGNIVDVHLDRNFGGTYIEKSGLLCNNNGHMGYFYTHVYTLDNNGFTHIFASYSQEVYYPDFEVSYYINKEPVSEEEYNTAVANAFDISNAKRFDNNVVDYDEIKPIIMAY